jgi:hypothetical protein
VQGLGHPVHVQEQKLLREGEQLLQQRKPAERAARIGSSASCSSKPTGDVVAGSTIGARDGWSGSRTTTRAAVEQQLVQRVGDTGIAGQVQPERLGRNAATPSAAASALGFPGMI